MSLSLQDFKQALGRFASGVTVVAVNDEAGLRGMTASAFLSVSLDPLLVLVSVAKKAQIHAPLLAGARWSASILAHDQSALSGHFAGYGEAEVNWEGPGNGPPHLQGALAWVECANFAAHDAGDHTLFVGRVEAVGYRDGMPLVYTQGKYRDLVPLA
jgi:flavin reductase (DIM6/NTAB) family NADH-FMN oxidoreductase RutF